MTNTGLAEELMRRGWWAEAQAAINRPDMHPAERTLQRAALICRRECAEWAAVQDGEMTVAEFEREMLRRFDRYTVQWFFEKYTGEGSLEWLKSERANALTD